MKRAYTYVSGEFLRDALRLPETAHIYEMTYRPLSNSFTMVFSDESLPETYNACELTEAQFVSVFYDGEGFCRNLIEKKLESNEQ